MKSVHRETITEIKSRLFRNTQYFECEAIDRTDDTITVLYPLRETRTLGSVLLPKGTLSFGYFRESLHFNIYHFVTPNGVTLATYFNICDQTRITTREVYWRDLIIDVLITAEGTCEVLDEDELPHDLEQELIELINHTRDYIVQHQHTLVQETEETSAAYLAALKQTDYQ